MRALVAAGVFSELEDGRLALNDAAAGLQADAPARTRETAFEKVYGQSLLEYYASHPVAEASGAARMTARSLPVTRELAASDLAQGILSMVDVGGGTGTVVTALLEAYPELRAVLYERPTILGLVRVYLTAQGFSDRCDVVAGDFFASVPAAPTCTWRRVLRRHGRALPGRPCDIARFVAGKQRWPNRAGSEADDWDV